MNKTVQTKLRKAGWLKPVSKKSRITQSQADAAVRRYLKDCNG